MDGSANLVIPAAAHAVINGRRSVRRYRPAAPVPRDTLRRILQAAIAAPSAHNRQPWRFVVVADKQGLADAMGNRLAADRTRDGDDPAAIERDVQRSRARITGAPIVLLVCLTLEEMDVYPEPRRAQAEYLMAVQSTAMAVQNLLLAAHAEGLGACWMCAPLFCPDTVCATLALPEGWRPQALITLGWPEAPAAPPRGRKPLDEVVLEQATPSG
jgi:F420 biosynthesis protein FbiB-like protein